MSMIGGMQGHTAQDGHATLHDRIEAPLRERIAHLEDQVHILTGHVSRRNDDVTRLEAEVERLKKTEQFLRSERPMARRLTQYENALASIAANTCCDTCQEAALVAQAALKKEKP